MKALPAIALLWLLLPLTSGANEPSFRVDGIALGETVSPAQAAALCPAKVANQANKLCRQTWQLSGAPVLRILEVRNHRLIGVSMSFAPEAYDALVERYTREMGAPSRRWDEAIRTRDGYQVTNDLTRWHTPQGALLIQRYGSFATRGFGQIRIEQGPLASAP